MKSTSLCNVAALLTLTFILYSCGASPTTSQLHLLGADTQRIPLAEAPAGMISIGIYTIPSHQNSPFTTAKEERTTTDTFELNQYECYGSYITKGAVLTAKHCMNLDNETIVMIKLRFFSGHILYLKPPRPTSTSASASTFTSILHPAADLALLIFDAQTLQPPPHTVQLAFHSNNEPPSLYTGAVVYSSGGTDKHLNYPDDSHPYSSQVREARELYVINQYHPKSWDYLDLIDLYGFRFMKERFDIYSYSCNRPWSWKLIRNHLLSLFNYDEDDLNKVDRITENTELLDPSSYYDENDCGKHGPLLIMTANLRAPDNGLTKSTPREVLFCPGDSGSGVLNSSGRIIGVLLGSPLNVREGISQGNTYSPFDSIAVKELKCSHVAMAADLHKHRHWIETTLRSAL